MKTLAGLAFAVLLALAQAPAAQAAGPLRLVAAENFYGGVAQQIGGREVEVVSVMSNPDQDPHLFETSPAVLRQLAAAQIVIYNGADYDPWMPKLLTATPQAGARGDRRRRPRAQKGRRQSAPLVRPGHHAGGRARLAAALAQADPAHAADYQARLTTFLASLKPIDEKIGAHRARNMPAPP